MSRSRLIFLGVGLVVLAGLIGLGVSCDRKPVDGKTFKVATFTWVGYAPLYLAKEKGFFEGITVDLQKIEDTPARRAALTSGKIDGSVDIVDSFTVARAAGLPAQVVLKLDDSMGADGIIVKKEIKSIKDLKGKLVAYPKDQPSHFFLLALLDKEGMTIKDIQKKETQEADQAGAAFVAGSVDAAVTWEPFLTQASGMENARVLTSSRETPGLIVDVFTVREDFLKENPETVKAFTRGWFKAVEYWRDNPKEANEIMAKAMGLKPQEFAKMIGGLKYSDLADNQAFFKRGGDGQSKFTDLVTRADKVWLREGLIKKSVDPNSVDGSSIVQSLK